MIKEYFETLFDLLKNTIVTNSSGTRILFSDGINEVISLIEAKSKYNKLIFIGNGGSAAIASHEAIDFLKNGKIRTLCFNEASLLTCMSNDYGYENVFSYPIELLADEGDILVAISSSGESQNILNAVKVAKEKGCMVITFSGFRDNNILKHLGDFNFYVSSFEYGFVELSHQIILHMILDFILEKRRV